MDSKTQGAWIIHHTRKLQTVSTRDFYQLEFSGKCGLLLSCITAQNQTVLTKPRVEALACANDINPRLELPAILAELERQKLVQQSNSAVEVLGLSTNSVLDHTSTIFSEGAPASEEQAVINISEAVSERPILESELIQLTGDTLKLSTSDATNLVNEGECIGFFDVENNDRGERLVFNGNLFRMENIRKVNAVMRTLTSFETERFRELNEMLAKHGCITLSQALKVMTKPLFRKLQSVGLFDVNMIGNETGSYFFVTRPAFSKFSSSIADDAFDLAKAFVSALTYGMGTSPYNRGRIQIISKLMEKLISGKTIGPATAIGYDYQALEMRGVLEVKPSVGSMYTMRLLKPEVGRLALAVIQEGEVTSETLSQLPNAAVCQYSGPESNRFVARKNITEPLKRSIGNILTELRTGGFKN